MGIHLATRYMYVSRDPITPQEFLNSSYQFQERGRKRKGDNGIGIDVAKAIGSQVALAKFSSNLAGSAEQQPKTKKSKTDCSHRLK